MAPISDHNPILVEAFSSEKNDFQEVISIRKCLALRGQVRECCEWRVECGGVLKAQKMC